MSSIWTDSAAASEVAPLEFDAWRVVESQHHISTRKLVDSDAEQGVLEAVLERHKPPLRDGGHLHYLLFTPFRYPPLRHGSRFATRWEPSLWYGSEAVSTAMAEVAYYRLVFLDGSTADLGPVEADLTAFRVPVRVREGLDLTTGRFEPWAGGLASRTSYEATQPLGAAMREGGVRAFRYRSARDGQGGINVGVFTPRAFVARKPKALQSWYCVSTRAVVECRRRDYVDDEFLRFEREAFLVEGQLPRPAV